MRKILITLGLLLIPAFAFAQDPVPGQLYPLNDWQKRLHVTVGASMEWKQTADVKKAPLVPLVEPPQEAVAFAGISYDFSPHIVIVANSHYAFESQRFRESIGIRYKLF
jgi:hypothetical protein